MAKNDANRLKQTEEFFDERLQITKMPQSTMYDEVYYKAMLNTMISLGYNYTLTDGHHKFTKISN